MKWQPPPVFLPGKFHGQRVTVHGVTKGWTQLSKWAHTQHTRCFVSGPDKQEIRGQIYSHAFNSGSKLFPCIYFWLCCVFVAGLSLDVVSRAYFIVAVRALLTVLAFVMQSSQALSLARVPVFSWVSVLCYECIGEVVRWGWALVCLSEIHYRLSVETPHYLGADFLCSWLLDGSK